MAKPVVKILDVKNKLVVIRVLGNKNDVDSQEPLAHPFLVAGATSVLLCNHMIRLEAWTDKELEEVGLKRI